VTIGAGEYDAVHSLTVSDAKATLAIDGGLTATTTIAATAGTIALSGSLTAGTIIAAGGFFTIPTEQNAMITAAAFQGTLDLSAYDANLTLTGGPSFSGAGGTGRATLTVTGQSSALYEQGNVTLDNAAIALGNANGASTLLAEDTSDSGSLLTLGVNAAITQAGIYATLGDSGYDTDGVFLSGAITAGVNDGLFTVTGNLFENDGKITVSNGDTFAIQSTTFTNAGSLSVTGATLGISSNGTLGGTVTVSNSTLDLGSTVTTAQLLSILTGADTVNLSGTIDNAGTLNLGQTKPIAAFSLAGGEIDGGTLILPGGTLSATNGELLNVTVDGGLVLNTGSLLLHGTQILNAAGSAPGAISIGAGASLEMEGYASITNAVTLSGGTLYVTGQSLATNLSTGVDSFGNVLPAGVTDPHWSVNVTDGPARVTSYTITANAPNGGVIAGSAAIAAYDSIYAPPAPYTFTETFTLTAAQVATEALLGTWYIDDAGTFSLNGHVLGTDSTYADIPILTASDLQVGVNTLTATMTSGDQSYDYMDFEGGLVLPTMIAAGTEVQGSGTVTDQPTGDGASAITNEGTIAANVSGTTLTVSPTDFLNQGLMTATNGGTLAIDAGTWANAGTISVTGATLDLGGTFGPAALAGIGNSGGTINLTGTLNNAGSTLSVGTGSTLGVLTLLVGSVIEGGTIADGGSGIAFSGDSNGGLSGPTLDGVTYEGTLTFNPFAETVFVANGIALEGAGGIGTGTIDLTAPQSLLEFNTSGTISNAVVNIGASNATVPWGSAIEIDDSTNAGLTLTVAADSVLQDDTANTVAEIDNTFNETGDSLVNNGSLVAGAKGAILYLDDNSYLNDGLLQATNGGMIDFVTPFAGTSGTLTNLNGTVLTGGTYAIGAASTLELVNNAKIVTDAADIILTGTGSAIEASNGTAQITIDQTLTTIASAGTLALAGGRNWNSSLAFTDAGQLQLAGSSFKTGTLTIAAGGTLGGYGTVTTAATNNGVIEAEAGGTLTLSAGISGTGTMKIDAGGTLDAATAVAATETVSFGSAGGTLKIDSPATFTAPITGFGAGDTIDFSTLAGATITVSGTTLTVKSGTTTDSFTINALPVGTLLITASDGKSGTELTASAQAVASGHSPEPVAFGNHHVGDTLTQALSITNMAPADAYSETLDGSIGSATAGVTATGSFTHLAAGATSTALAVSLASTTPGAKSGTAQITLNSDGAGVDGRGTTALASQTVTISGAIYAYAADSLSTTSIAFGNTHIGDSVSQAVTLTNSAAASGGYTEGLDASIAGTTGSATASGAVSLLGAGASSTALSLGLATATAGAASGHVTLALASDGTGTSGLGLTALASQTIAVTGTVYAEAAPVLASTTLSLGNAHVGAADSAALSVTNTTTDATYTEGLDARFTGTSGNATDAGTLSLLAAGATDSASLSVGLATATAGALTGTATLGLVSDGSGTSGLGLTALPAQTVAVSGAVYAYAAPSLAATTYNAGVVHVGSTITQALTITNAATDPAFTEGLNAAFLANTGSVTSSGTLSLLGAGASDSQSLLLALNTATSGTISGTATLGLTSDGAGTSGLGTTALPSQMVTLGATVDNYAVASLKQVSGSGTLTASGSSYTLNLGSVLQGAAALSADLEVLNGATGLADLLGGSFTVTTASTAITNTGLTAFSGLGAGGADTAPVVKLATTTAGTFSEKITIAAAGSNASGYSGALTPITLTVTGIVAQTYTLTTGVDTISAGAGNDLVLATNATLNAGDSINGGGGTNTLKLSGGGTFDLSQPTTLTNVQLVTAQEASGAAAQTVILRNGYTGTITAVSGAAGSGITIIGAADSAVIDLGTGNDTVTVGASTETIKGGGGNNTFNVTAATIGAKIAGGTGTNTLAVSGGGTVTMGTSITAVTKVALNDAGVTGTTFTANATSGLAITGGAGTDTITLGAAKQSVAAGTGTTLVKGVIADAGDLVTTAGTTTFELTTGGTGTLNAGDGGITVKLDAATNLGLGTAAFITAMGAAAGKDTLTAGGANQTLESLGGSDTLVGSAAFGDTFLGTAAGFTGDVIKNFGGSDVIDFTDIMAATFKALTYTGTATSGKLVVTDGSHSGSVTLAGSYTKASFVVGTDAHGGTLISFS
jgi:hypothetical protein